MPGVDRPPASDPVGPVGLLVLAAGGSTRLGRPKQLLPYRGRTLLRHSVEQALASAGQPVIVVLGAEAEACARDLSGVDRTQPDRLQTAVNAAWADGMGSSIRCGIAALRAHAPDARGAIVTLSDQPRIDGAFLDALIARFDAIAPPDASAIVAAEYAGRPGVPALFGRGQFAALEALDGVTGAQRLLRDPAARVVRVPCPDAAIDVDTIADYEALSEPGASGASAPALGAMSNER